MTKQEFKDWIECPPPPFAKRVRITETEFKRHVAEEFGIKLNDSNNKQFAERIFQLRRFYFKIVVG